MNHTVYIIMYHYVRDLGHSRYPEIKGLDLELFRQQVQYLKANFNIITMEEMMAAVEENENLPEKSVLLTFDDGYVDHYMNVFPILKEEKVQGSFFIPGKTFDAHQLLDVNKIHFILASADVSKLLPDVFERMDYYRGSEYSYPNNKELFTKYAVSSRFDNKETIFVKRMLQTVLPEMVRNRISSDLFEKYVGVSEEKFAYELYMSYDQIRIMKESGMFIGLHGYDHYWLGNLSEELMKKDTEKALQVMDEFIDKNHWVMNYPYGSYSTTVTDYIKTKGCSLGLATEVKKADLESDDKYTFPRLDCNDFPPKSKNFENFE